MNEEEEEDRHDRRLSDVVILQERCQPVEAAFAGQDGTDQRNVPPHEQRQHQAGAATDHFIGDLASSGS